MITYGKLDPSDAKDDILIVLRAGKAVGMVSKNPSGKYLFFPSTMCTGLSQDELKDITNKLQSLNSNG